MSVVKVQFTRVENEAEINNTQIKDGQLLYTRDGKIYIDYGTARKKITSLIELLTVDSTAPAECSLGDMYYNTTTNLIYTAIGTDTWSSTGELPSNKYLYVDLTNARLYYYDGVSFTSYGGGGSITMDTQMSDSSENAVQNKVIKQYVDTEISSIPEEVIISNTQPSSSSNKIWIDTGEIAQAHTEITNSYSESTGLGYSANYVNNLHTYSETEQRIGTWINEKPLYRKLIVSTVGTISSSGTIVNNEISTPTNSDLTTLRIKEAYVLNAGRLIPAIMYLNDTLNYFIKIYPLNTNKIRISANNSSYSENTVYILVEYTKTTD